MIGTFTFPRYVELPKVTSRGGLMPALKEMVARLEVDATNVVLKKTFDPEHRNLGALEFVDPKWYAVAADVLRQVVEWVEGQPVTPSLESPA